MNFGQIKYSVGCYCRLSRDDGSSGESASIETQKKMLADYCQANGFSVYDFYCDDGYTGTNFNRPNFIRMMEDVESGAVNLILVKDLSRLGRNHIETGRYIEEIFPQKGVRFIAVSDGVDSEMENMYSDIMTPMRNVMNEYYPADISRKTRLAFKTKAEHGEFIGTYAPYGYRKSAEDKHVLEPDEQTAPLIVEMFEMVAYKGFGYNKIAKVFREGKVLTPAAYRAKLAGKPYTKDPYDWNMLTVRKMLENQAYLGHTVNGKKKKLSFKSKIVVNVPEEKWTIVRNTHQPLVTERLWNDAHARLGERKRTGKKGQENMFAGLVKCDLCGKALTIANDSKHINFFACNTYKRKGKDYCTFHYIRYEHLYQIVLTDVQSKLNMVHRDEDAFAKKVLKKIGTATTQKQKAMSSEKSEIKARLKQLEGKYDRLYDNFDKGILSEKKFKDMAAKTEAEEEQLKARLAELEQQFDEQMETEQNVAHFIERIREYTEIKELNREILNRLIEKIVVSERVPDENGGFSQKIKIYYRFIGDFGEERFAK